jgi:primase-polymerase (primpol)-like protein
MRAAPRWVAWKLEKYDKGKWTKVPYNARTGGKASPTIPQTWTSFKQAIAAYLKGGYQGIGFMFANGWCGIDLDECRNPVTGQIEPWAIDIVARINSYCEVSPSMTGLHLFTLAELPKVYNKDKNRYESEGFNNSVNGHKVEIYDWGRFFTFTADHLESTPKEVNERQDEVVALYNWAKESVKAQKKAKQQSKQRQSPKQEKKGPREPLSLSDSEILEAARLNSKSGKFERLLAGNRSDYIDDAHPEGDPSRADAALVMILCFYSPDDSQVERLWRRSGLYRDKLERQDYVTRTIRNARANQTESYSPDYKEPKVEPSDDQIKESARRATTRRLEKAKARREFFRRETAKARATDSDKAQNDMEAIDCLNFILSEVNCPPARRGYALAMFGVLRERGLTGREHEPFNANRVDLGKRLKGDSAASCTVRALKAKAQREEEEWEKWQAASGYVLIEAQTGGMILTGERLQKAESLYNVPLFDAWRDALAMARLDPLYNGNKRSRTKALRKAAKAVAPSLQGVAVNKDLDGVRRPHKGLVAAERRQTTTVLNLIRRRIDGAALRATQHVIRHGRPEVAAKNLMAEIQDYSELVVGEVNGILALTAEQASKLLGRKVKPLLYSMCGESWSTEQAENEPDSSHTTEARFDDEKTDASQADANGYKDYSKSGCSRPENSASHAYSSTSSENEDGESFFSDGRLEDEMDEVLESIMAH